MSWVDIDYACSVVKQMYPSDTWRRRVRSMSDDQVLAIYYKYEEDRRKTKCTTVTHQEVAQPTIQSFVPDEGEQLILAAIF